LSSAATVTLLIKLSLAPSNINPGSSMPPWMPCVALDTVKVFATTLAFTTLDYGTIGIGADVID
jgi:hypothetical protein